MNKPNYIKYLGLVNSDKYIDFIDQHIIFSENNNYGRKKYFSGCKTNFIVEKTHINNTKIIDKFFNLSTELKEICNQSYGAGKLFNAQFSLIPAGEKIKIHEDLGFISSLTHKIHLPIITNNDVLFFIGDKKFNFKKDQLIEINNKRSHYVENNSDNDRIHLIIDFIPSKFLPYLK